MAVSDDSKQKIAEFVEANEGVWVIYTDEFEKDVLVYAGSFPGKGLAELINSLSNSSTVKAGDSFNDYTREKYPELAGMTVLHVW